MRRELKSRHSLDPEVLEDFNVLVSFLESHAGYGVWKSMDGKNQVTVTFENLWALFRDGDLLVLQDQLEERRLFKLIYLEEQISDDGLSKGTCIGMQVQFWHISWSSGDKAFRRRSSVIRIPRFAGMRRVLTLPIYPLRYEDEDTRTSLLRKLQDRGEKWSTQISNPPACFDYVGHAVLEDEVPMEKVQPTHVSHPDTIST